MYTCYMMGKGNFAFMDVSIDKISQSLALYFATYIL